MKIINFRLLLCVFGMAILLLSCANAGSGDNTTNTTNSTSYETIDTVENIDMKNMNLYKQTECPQFVDDANAKISLYVNAEKDQKGEFMFDDRHDWLLLMETSQGSYPLFPRKAVQLGGVSYVTFDDLKEDKQVFHVLVTTQQSAGYEIYDCVYDNETKTFSKIQVYNMENINFFGN